MHEPASVCRSREFAARRSGGRPLSVRVSCLVLMATIVLAGPLSADTHGSVRSSLLLLIDTSGSMGSEIGNGNSEIKMEAAKDAAIAAIDRALASSLTEVAILAFEGDCGNPISRYQAFTTDVGQLTHFIGSLQPGGGTPMADALLVANRFMHDNGTAGAQSQMIVLLADGDNDCGDVAQAMDQLRAAGIVFRHETVGFGIEPASDAARDLRHVANASGGEYHHAASATQLADLFMEFVDTFTVIDMLGMFGNSQATKAGSSPGGQAAASAEAGTQATSPRDDQGAVTSMLGAFKMADADQDTAGALAIDRDQGPAWGYATEHATEAEAKRTALRECGENCRVVLSFTNGCAAYAADQKQGSSMNAGASGFDTADEATEAALHRCRQAGGAECLVRVWACGHKGIGGGRWGREWQLNPSYTEGTGDSDENTAGALAIVSMDTSAWVWDSGYATVEEAEAQVLDECGDGCHIVLSFEDGCFAYAIDRTFGSSIIGWAAQADSSQQAAQAALDACRKQGGQDCVLSAWNCSGS